MPAFKNCLVVLTDQKIFQIIKIKMLWSKEDPEQKIADFRVL